MDHPKACAVQGIVAKNVNSTHQCGVFDSQDMLNALPWPALVISDTHRILISNQAAQTMLSLPARDIPLTNAIRQPSVLVAIEACFSNHDPATTDFRLRRFNAVIDYAVHLRPIDGGGQVLAVFVDTTSQAATDQQRRDFVANVSHELRSPLTALMGFIETLQGSAKNDPAAQQMFLGLMAQEAARMNDLAKGLLSLSKVEAEQARRPNMPHHLQDIIASTTDRMRPQAIANGFDISMNITDGLPAIMMDPAQLDQVLVNLLENAMRYATKAAPQITVTLSSHPKDKLLRTPVQIMSIADCGHGIAAHHIPRLTERFFRVDDHRTRAAGGTGLGLAIVKHIVQRHRGRMAITSQLGQGTTVEVILPE